MPESLVDEAEIKVDKSFLRRKHRPFASPSASTFTMPQHIRSPKLLLQVTTPHGVVTANQGLQWTRGPVALCGVMTHSEVGVVPPRR